MPVRDAPAGTRADALPQYSSRAEPSDADARLLAHVVQGSADAIFCQDMAGRVTTWNAAAERVYGYAAEEIVGRPADVLMPDKTRQHLQAAHRAAMSGDRVERFDSWHRRQDGSLIAVSVSTSPLRDLSGQVVAVATTAADITERVQLTSELARTRAQLQRQNTALTRSNRDLEQFAYVASHDLSEPLRVMTGYVSQLERRYDELLDERGRRYMQHIVEASARMRSLIEDLLDYSRFLQVPAASALVDTGQVLDRVFASLSVSLRESGAITDVGALHPVWSDPAHVESLLQNLVSNAVKFVAPGQVPQLAISAEESGGWVTLAVADNGIGIEPEYRERVFRMFQRLHVREAYAGTGIGLAIAQQIVELHGGRIWIEDSPLGGTRICCTMPAGPSEDDGAHA